MVKKYFLVIYKIIKQNHDKYYKKHEVKKTSEKENNI